MLWILTTIIIFQCWRDQVRYTLKIARSKTKVSVDLDGNVHYTTENEEHDKIMALVGWELADAANNVSTFRVDTICSDF